MDRLAGVFGFGGVYGTGIVRPQRGSSIVIGYESALAFWRRVRVEDPMWTRELLGQLYPDEMLATLDAEALAADTSLRPLELPNSPLERVRRTARILGLDEPLDVVVGRQTARRNSQAATCRVWTGPLANGLIACVDRGTYVAAPELALAQMSHGLSISKLIALGMELCGSYSPLRGDCVWNLAALTNAVRLRWLAGFLDGCRGAKKFRRASQYILDNSASPMESKLAMLLSLPRPMGGFGCEPPQLNRRIELTARAKRECARSYLVADLFFPNAGVDVEYQGKEWHRSDDARRHDEARQNALTMMGLTCLFVSSEHMVDEARLAALSDTIRRRAGVRKMRSPETPEMRIARSALLYESPLVLSN